MTHMRDRQKGKGHSYPSPYMDIAGSWYPSSVKDLFRWCKYYFYSNPIVNSIIYKLSEYPITDFIYETDLCEEGVKELGFKSKKKIKRIIEIILNLKSFLIEIGLDYFTYGNAFVSINTPFKRYLTCPNCKKEYDIGEIKYQLKNYKFVISCEKCSSHNVIAKIIDKPINDPDSVNLVRWNPENIQIDYNPITGKHVYFYRIPNKIRNDIIRGKKIVIEEIPAKILEALSKNMDLKLDNTNLFHYKRPTLAEEDMGWGKPIILSIMKDIFYLQTLRKAQEAIAVQHIVPLDVLFPAQNGSVDPYTHIDLSRWRGKIESELKKWRGDPNYISIMPIPVGVSRIGGDGRMLLITPEIESTLKMIAAGLGVPLEFVFGGLTWSGGSVSLRTIENHFLTTRQHHHKFLLWLIDRLRNPLGLPKGLEIRMVEFKMADDVQQKHLYVGLNKDGKISDETMLTEFGLDYDKELDRKNKEIDKQNEIYKRTSIAQAKASGEAQKTTMNYQMDIQEDQRKKAEEIARKEGRGTELGQMQTDNNMAGMGSFQSQPTPPNVPQPTNSLPEGQQINNATPNMGGDKNPASGENMKPMEVDWSQEARAIIQKANALPKDQKDEFMAKLKVELPTMYKIVNELMNTGKINRGETDVNMAPEPEQKPSRRQGAV